MTPDVVVTGATGAIGGRVAARLADAGVAQRLVVRDVARAPRLAGAEVTVAAGYHDRAAMLVALRGARTLFLVSARESPDRVAEHATAIEAAVEAGVERIVYLSFLGAAPDATFTFARDHYATEQRIRASGLAHTFLRNSQYVDFVPSLADPERGIVGPAGEGRIAWVARADSADAAFAVLTGSGHDGATYDLTGPEARTLAWAAEQLSRAAGRPIPFRDETEDEAYRSRAGADAPRFEVQGWVSSYLAVRTGEMDVVSDALETLLGRPGQELPDFLAAHPEAVAHLRR